MINVIPLKRLGISEDIANCALFVASPAASYITAQTIVVDGGVVMTFPNFAFLNKTFI
jgi:NAD(P)-dependent dehydrogenase (short-subunit alcohol dehydrogenase family)